MISIRISAKYEVSMMLKNVKKIEKIFVKKRKLLLIWDFWERDLVQ